MKYLMFLLFPFIAYGQTVCPDTIHTLNNKVYACLVTFLNKSEVHFYYPGYGESKLVTDAVSGLVISGKGNVFEQKKRYLYDVDELEIFISGRKEVKQYFEEQRRKKEEEKERLVRAQAEKENLIRVKDSIATELKKLAAVPLKNDSNPGIVMPSRIDGNRWSFGILFIPYSSAKYYGYANGSGYNDGSVTTTVNNEINMEGQFACRLNNNLSLTFDVGYTAGYTESTYEYYSNPASGQGNSSGYNDSDDLKMLSFHFGIKYYFTNYSDEKVNPYILAGAGKTLAFATSKYEQLFVSPSTDKTENNQNDFIEDMNSPFSFYFGFGAEYMFNKSLSVYSVIRFYYSKTYAEYKSRTITRENYINEVRREYDKSDFITRIGLGLNFYF
jgi:outer membrane protein W